MLSYLWGKGQDFFCLCVFVCVCLSRWFVNIPETSDDNQLPFTKKNRFKTGTTPRPSVTNQVWVRVGFSPSFLQGIVLIIGSVWHSLGLSPLCTVQASADQDPTWLQWVLKYLSWVQRFRGLSWVEYNGGHSTQLNSTQAPLYSKNLNKT